MPQAVASVVVGANVGEGGPEALKSASNLWNNVAESAVKSKPVGSPPLVIEAGETLASSIGKNDPLDMPPLGLKGGAEAQTLQSWPSFPPAGGPAPPLEEASLGVGPKLAVQLGIPSPARRASGPRAPSA